VVSYTSVDQVFSEPIFRRFEEEKGLRVCAVFDTEETKSTGVLNRIVAEAGHPQADVFWSGDPVRPFLLIERGLVGRYASPAARAIPVPFKAEDASWTGLAARARVLLVNTERVAREAVPRSIRALADPRWRGRAAIANPLFGTTTVHVAALFTVWGEVETKDFLESLRANGVTIASSNGEVKRLVSSGEVAFGLTDTDDAHQAVAAGAPVEIVYPDADGLGTLFMPTTVVKIRGGPHPEAAERFIDYLLSPTVERQMADVARHIPLNPEVEAPAGVPDGGSIRAMSVDYARVAEEMKRIEPWLRRWVGL
jgi:iron(III) transport system substrate-binding protein